MNTIIVLMAATAPILYCTAAEYSTLERSSSCPSSAAARHSSVHSSTYPSAATLLTEEAPPFPDTATLKLAKHLYNLRLRRRGVTDPGPLNEALLRKLNEQQLLENKRDRAVSLPLQCPPENSSDTSTPPPTSSSNLHRAPNTLSLHQLSPTASLMAITQAPLPSSTSPTAE